MNQPNQSEALGSFLQEQQAEGSRDSEGVFTIDLKVAKRKLAAFQLPSTESWILVLVQAAHRGGATDIKVTQTNRETSVVISGTKSWSWTDLQSVLDGESTTDGAVLAYAVAVRALCGNQQLTGFRVKAPDDTSARWRYPKFRLEHNRVEDLLLKDKTVFEVSHLGEFPERRSPFFQHRRCAREQLVALQQTLVKSCFVSSVPITVDRLSIPGLHLGEPLPPHYRRLPLAIVPLEDYRIPSITFSAALSAAKNQLPDPAPVSESSRSVDSKKPIGALAFLSVAMKNKKSLFRSFNSGLSTDFGESRLLWIQDGVVVGSHTLPISGALELTLVLSAAGLKTDLSGLELVQSPELRQRKKLAMELASTRLSELWEKGQTEDTDFFGLARLTTSPGSWLASLAAIWENDPPSQPDEQNQLLQQDLQRLPQRLLEAIES